jgi:hypothetical protein
MNSQEIINAMPSTDNTTPSKADIVSKMAAASELAKNPEIVKEVTKYGKVPIVYRPTRSMTRPPATKGVLEFISEATTVDEVNNLVSKGLSNYKNVSDKTIRKWKKAAEMRLEKILNE